MGRLHSFGYPSVPSPKAIRKCSDTGEPYSERTRGKWYMWIESHISDHWRSATRTVKCQDADKMLVNATRSSLKSFEQCQSSPVVELWTGSRSWCFFVLERPLRQVALLHSSRHRRDHVEACLRRSTCFHCRIADQVHYRILGRLPKYRICALPNTQTTRLTVLGACSADCHSKV